MVEQTIGRVLTDMEREIEAEVRNRPPVHEPRPVNFAPPRVRAPALSMPDYVEHRDGATEIGKLSAEAVVREYEAAAKEIEAMGGELIERVRQCEAMTRDALAVTEEMKDTAARYREEAKRIFLQIENCSLVTAEVRKTCTELKEKIAAPVTIDRVLKPKKVKPVAPSDGVS
ncbi:MAG: hypothetical protein QOF72_2578 [Blastocatellia bacterium]|jgi:hypothetical protein|nr:hypothetical protein [Blastocatellia bacterium]